MSSSSSWNSSSKFVSFIRLLSSTDGRLLAIGRAFFARDNENLPAHASLVNDARVASLAFLHVIRHDLFAQFFGKSQQRHDGFSTTLTHSSCLSRNTL